jgi:hypothetical protein
MFTILSRVGVSLVSSNAFFPGMKRKSESKTDDPEYRESFNKKTKSNRILTNSLARSRRTSSPDNELLSEKELFLSRRLRDKPAAPAAPDDFDGVINAS